jgi:uncharacterized protein (DUF2336 family)
MTSRITQSDIRRLISDPSVQVRSDLASKLCRGLHDREFYGREKETALDILRLLLRDTASKVRQVLARELCHQNDIPADIIQSLANDDDDIAEMILAHSPALDEETLIAIVESTSRVQKLHAIARRNSISARLSDTILRHSDVAVAKTLLNNPNAALSDETLDYVIEEYHHDQSVLEVLVYRGNLPYKYAEILFQLVSDQLKKDLTRRYRLQRAKANDLTRNAREVSVLGFLSPWMGQQDIQDLVSHMHRNKRLTDSVIVRALCSGNIRFFETAMARRSGISVSNAKILLLDPGNKGFDALYDQSGMPESFREALRALFKLALEQTKFGQFHQANFPQRLIDRIVLEGYDKTIENMPYLLSIIGWSMRDATVH